MTSKTTILPNPVNQFRKGEIGPRRLVRGSRVPVEGSLPRTWRAMLCAIFLFVPWPSPSWSRTCDHDWTIELIESSDGANVAVESSGLTESAETGETAFDAWAITVEGGFVVEPGGDEYWIRAFSDKSIRIFLNPPEVDE